jgi:2-polyprenyl-3-methyl-5-hydroxy-6-metoxy-1,4-benzoquinol methylase
LNTAWQKEVYQLAADLSSKSNYSSIIDVGCGSGYKLVHMLGQFDTTGIEVNPAYDWLCKKYPARKWLLFDNVQPSTLKADLIICADVIEHLDNPDDLLDFISEMDFQQLVISTPERDAVAGKNDYGPPENVSHYREWNAVEFKNYLRQWFHVKEQHIFNAKSVTQVVICVKK